MKWNIFNETRSVVVDQPCQEHILKYSYCRNTNYNAIKMNFWIFVTLSILATQTNAYKVLVAAPFNGKSHFMYMQSFVRALLDRGHEVSFLTSNTMNYLKLANYTELLIDPPLDIESHIPIEVFLKKTNTIFSSLFELIEFSSMFNAYNLQSETVQKLVRSTDMHFDVILLEDFFAESFLILGHKFKAPVVTICPFGATEYLDRQMGLLTPSSIVPHWMLTYSDNMSFGQRWFNSIVSAYDWIIRRFFYLPVQEKFTKQFFTHLEPMPSIDDMLRNVSLVLINTHRALAPPRPMMPNMINIGGAHLKPAKPLPKDLQTFLDTSEHGVIYFSLGTVVKSSKLPKEKIQAFLDTFETLKQRVLWKFEDESLTVPANVMIRKWMPQNDILAHPNVVLFISHGGAFGTSESIYHGVPLFLIPFFGDQHRNAHRISGAGHGKYLTLAEITKESFSEKLNDLLSNPSYMVKAKEISDIFQSNLVHPMDEAMYWIEHVCKFRGAKHLKSHAVNISWISYLLLDVLIVNVLCVLVVLYILYHLIKKLFAKKKSNLSKNKKQK